MSIHIKGVGSIVNTHILNSSVEKNTQNTTNNSAKNQLQFNNTKRNESSSQIHNHNNKVNNVNFSNSNCVANLNITKMHIDKMHTEITKKLYNRNIINKRTFKKIEQTNDEEKRKHYQSDEFEEPVLSELDIYHIGLIKDLYHNIESNQPCFEHYIIIIIFQTIENTNLINKQLITAIPLENNIPKKTISEITIIDRSGQLKTYNNTVSLHNGGLEYTDDWLKIQQTQKLNLHNSFFKFIIEYQNQTLNGIAFNNQTNRNFTLSNCTLYIPNFSQIWC
jgi:hypothetical protein